MKACIYDLKFAQMENIAGDVRTFCSYCQYWIHANCTNNWMCNLCSDSAPADNVYMFPTVLNDESEDSAWPTAAQTWNASSAQDVIGVDYLSDVSSTESSQASNSFLSLSENTSYFDEKLEDCFQEIKLKRLEHPQNFLIAHLNINSLIQKFYKVEHLLRENIVDFLAFSETKIDDTFPDKQFHADFFNMYRKDKSKHSGGLMAYIRSAIPSRQRKDLEPEGSPCLIIKALLNKQKWCFVTYYNSPSTSDAVFKNIFSKTLDNVTAHYSNYVICGDLNYDLTKNILFGLDNLVKGPTCFKSKHGTLLDVIILNKSSTFYTTLNIVNSVSDFHNMVATMMRLHVPFKHDKYIQYRSFKKYNKINYTSSIENKSLNVKM